MYPLALFSLLGLAIFIEKLVFLRRMSRDSQKVAESAIESLHRGDKTIPGRDDPVSVILNRLLALSAKGMGADALVRAAQRECARLEDVALRGMIWLAIIGSTSPFIGLFGTVVGIYNAFHGLSRQGLTTDPSGNPELIRGIAEALVATATGLLVAVPAVIAYNFLLREIRSRITRIELAVSDFAEVLGQRGGGTK